MPVDCLLGSDLEHSLWKEVELKSHLEMLGLPEWVCVTTWSMATQERSQGSLEKWPRQLLKTKGRGWGKSAPEIPIVGEEADTAPELTGEDIAALGDTPQLSGWQADGGPTREDFCKLN